jgi:hypothetical protein
MNFKHFFIIGAQRSGTTYLSKILDAHPQIFMAKPLIPEPKYFLNTPSNFLDYTKYIKDFFPTKKRNIILGEKTNAYFENSSIFYKIKKIINDFKIIIILRNPIDRAISHYNFSRKSLVENLNFQTAINEEKNRSEKWQDLIDKKISSNPFSYVEHGKYINYIHEWEKLIGKEKIIFIVSENFFGNISSFKNLYRQLGVNDSFVPKKFKFKINQSNYDKNIISPKLIVRLKNEFKNSNYLLQKKYNLDISRWEK